MNKIIAAVIMLALAMALVACTTQGVRTPSRGVSAPPNVVRVAQPTPPPPPQPVAKAATVAPSVAAPAVATPVATSPWKWVNFGAAPYATTRAEAMKTRESAFRKLGFPERCIAPLMKETGKAGEKTTMKVGDRFTAQMSKGAVVHGIKEGGGIVAFKSPVRGMEYAAPAEKWTINCDGQSLTVLLPEVCYNLTSIIGRAVPKVATAVPPVAGVCPNGWTVTANAWSLSSMPEGLRKEIEARIAAAKARSKANLASYGTGDSVSRYGKRLREEVKVHAPVNADFVIQIGNRNVGVLKMNNGIGTFRFAEDPRSDVVTVTWSNDFISPEEGVMKIFPREWQVCGPHNHGIVP